MTIETTSCAVSHTGDGQKTVFDYNFLIPEGAIEVVLTSGDVATVLSEQDYSVFGLNAATGGSVTLNVAPSAEQKVTIRRNLDPVQLADLDPVLVKYAQTVEGALDRHAMVMQQFKCELSRAVKVPIGSDRTPSEVLDEVDNLPAAVDEALASKQDVVQLMHVQECQPSGTVGGSSVSGWQKRNLNSVHYNSIAGATFANGAVTLPPGKYTVSAGAAAHDATSRKLALFTSDGKTSVLQGRTDYIQSVAWSDLNGVLELEMETSLALYHFIGSAKGHQGLGVPAGSGYDEVYAELMISKLG